MTSATFGSKKFRCRKPNRGQALIGVTTTTICGTDLHIVSEVKGE
jgi:threonine dehydrogenase-like Zn-dependent dehydrogenase